MLNPDLNYTQKYKTEEFVWWDNPGTKMREKARIVRCNPTDPMGPFYAITVMKDFSQTHAFEVSLHPYEVVEQKPKV